MATILITDDSEFIRLKLSKMLLGYGHAVLEAENGVKAIDSYKTNHPDLVLMDVTMPEMDGIMTLRQIRLFDAKAKVIMLTALGQDSVMLDAIKSGARDFIVKPFDRERIMNAIQKLLAEGIRT